MPHEVKRPADSRKWIDTSRNQQGAYQLNALFDLVLALNEKFSSCTDMNQGNKNIQQMLSVCSKYL